MYQPMWVVFPSTWLNGTTVDVVCGHWLRMMRSEGTERFNYVQRMYRAFVVHEKPTQAQIYAGWTLACIVNKL